MVTDRFGLGRTTRADFQSPASVGWASGSVSITRRFGCLLENAPASNRSPPYPMAFQYASLSCRSVLKLCSYEIWNTQEHPLVRDPRALGRGADSQSAEPTLISTPEPGLRRSVARDFRGCVARPRIPARSHEATWHRHEPHPPSALEKSRGSGLSPPHNKTKPPN
jgi:hypothetical protein